MAATIRVRRIGSPIGTFRKLTVLVDGEKAGTVGFGDEASIAVEPGAHWVAVRMDWVRSRGLAVMCGDRMTTNIDAIGLWFPASLVMSFVWPNRVFRLEVRP